MRDLLSQESILSSNIFKGFSKKWIERLLHSVDLQIELNNAEYSRTKQTFDGLFLETCCLLKQANIRHHLAQFLQRAGGLIDGDWHRDLRQILLDDLAENLPHWHAFRIPWHQVRQLAPDIALIHE